MTATQTDLDNTYHHAEFRRLRDECIALTPRGRRVAYVDRAEALLNDLEPDRPYPFAELFRRIKGRWPESYPNRMLRGEEVRHDLHLFIQDVSDSADVRAESAGQRVLTARELAGELRVSTKTIRRWRRQGLVSRKFVFDGHKMLGFLQSSVDRFVRENPERVRRGARFSHLSDEEREAIFRDARRLLHAGVAPAEATRRIARRTGRSPEAIRYTIRQLDRQQPGEAILPAEADQLPIEARRAIFRQHRRGEPVESIARRLHRSRTSVERAIAEMRARRIQELSLEYVPNEEFERALEDRRLEKAILAPAPSAAVPGRPRAASGLPPYLASLYEMPLLSRQQERQLFRKMNYLKFRAARLRGRLDPERPRERLMERIERAVDQAVAVKNEIVRANLRLVVSLARRYVGPTQTFFELVSDGNMSLMRAVEKFDYARGFKFSTYASWAIMKNFARTIPAEYRRQERFRTGQDESLPVVADERGNPHEELATAAARKSQIERLLDYLDERERRIIAARYGLGSHEQAQTLHEVGRLVGVTKERIRQIEARAMEKLRRAAAEQNVPAPEYY